MKSTPEKIYNRLPVPLQHAAASVYGLREARVRYGGPFRSRLAELIRSDALGADEIEEWQLAQLRRTLTRAAEEVPFYREVGVDPAAISERSDLAVWPILTKEDVREGLDSLVSERADRGKLRLRHTSGTTGSSLAFYSTRQSIAFQWAVWWRHRLRFGISPSTWHANFTGKPVVPLKQDAPPYWRWNLPLRQAVLGMQQLTPRTAPDVARFLDGRGFELWTGYPSIVHAFALSVLERGIELQRPPRVIALGAESVGELQRRDIARLTGAIVTDQYGLSEGCGNASQCPEGRYHEDFEFGVLECVDPEPLEGGRTRGRIVCTGFACPEAPLVRYDTGDVGVWFDNEDRCPCGLQSRTLESIEGRVEDYVLTPEGRRIMRFDYVFKDAASVKEAQVVQDRAGAITLRIVPREGFGPEDESFLRGEVARWISESLEVEMEVVDAIEREPNGKFRAVRSRLTPQEPVRAAEIIES